MNLNTQNMTSKFAGRLSLGSAYPVCVEKDGQFHSRMLRTTTNDGETTCKDVSVLACGLACSEVVSGRNLARVLMPGFEYERRVLEKLMEGLPAPPLALHTSAGVTQPLGSFIEALLPHLPWRRESGGQGDRNVAAAAAADDDDEDDDDWFVTLQVEGASAVLAAVDLMLQLRHHQPGQRLVGALSDWRVGVCATSYHGPPSSSLGAATPLFTQKHNQTIYPAPPPGRGCQHPQQQQEDEEQAKYVVQFSSWLQQHGASLGCLLVEPQWGSSASARCWHPATLRQVVDLCHERGVLVVADEVMCGLGRHGQACSRAPAGGVGADEAAALPTLFLSEAWGLPVDAVTFGKAICAGVYPMSGVLCRRGAKELGALGRSVLQSHTYSGSTVRALLTAIEVLRLLPALLPEVVLLGEVLGQEMRACEEASEGLFSLRGLGLMWGALLDRTHPLARDVRLVGTTLQAACAQEAVLPYFLPTGGFMVTPLLDVEEAVVREMGRRLVAALRSTVAALKMSITTDPSTQAAAVVI